MFKKYNLSNNALCLLDLSISNLSETILLKGNYNRLPTENFIIKITEFNGTEVVARENIYITARVGNTLTVGQRAYEPIPINGGATENIQQALPFSENSVIEQTTSAEVLKDIQNEITAINDEKLPTKVDRPNIVELTTDYTFDGNETNNTQFNVDTTSAETTLTIDLSLFPTTNGLYQFIVVKTSGDSNKVILDLAPGTIDGNTTYEISAENQSVSFVIESGTKAKEISTSKAPATTNIAGQTEVTETEFNDEAILNRVGEGNKKIQVGDLVNERKLFVSESITSVTEVEFDLPTSEYTRYRIVGSLNCDGGFQEHLQLGTYNSSTVSSVSQSRAAFIDYNFGGTTHYNDVIGPYGEPVSISYYHLESGTDELHSFEMIIPNTQKDTYKPTLVFFKLAYEWGNGLGYSHGYVHFYHNDIKRIMFQMSGGTISAHKFTVYGIR